MEKKFICVTGYYGTGSSAIISLLKEFERTYECNFNQSSYEHVLLYYRSGLLSLGKALQNATAIEADYAITSFINTMKSLNNCDFGWFGSYHKYTGDKFMENVDEFVLAISKQAPRRNLNAYDNVKFSAIKMVQQVGAKILMKRPIYVIGRKYIFDKRPTYYSLLSKESFYEEAKKFMKKYLLLDSKECDYQIYDHLLLPQHYSVLDKYFASDMKMIIVQRDPRDLFILNKYYWSRKEIDGAPTLPTDVNEFIKYYKSMIVTQDMLSNDNIIIINFEDAIYKKEKTVEKLCSFLNYSKKNFTKERLYFDERVSINNTQSFYLKDDWKTEISPIEDELSDYLYDFPYPINTNFSKMFDNPQFVTEKMTID